MVTTLRIYVFVFVAMMVTGSALGETKLSETSADALFLDEFAVSSEDLALNRGGTDQNIVLQVNDGEQNALLQDNTLTSAMTGNNSIMDNAFSNLSGISTVIQNSGNQVIIQDTTLVNVMFNQ